jgi:pimeloyl-ACP methyl ester carboxylesterase
VDFIPDTTALIQSAIRKPVVLIGHSNGGSIALGVAAQIPDLIRSVVLLDPSLCLRGSSLRTIAPYEWFVGVRDILTSARSPDMVISAFMSDIDDIRLQNVTTMIQNVDLVSVTVMINDQFYDGIDLKHIMQNVLCPTLLLYGELEAGAIVRQSDVEFFQTYVSKGTAIQIKGASHSPHWDQPALVLDYVSQFLGVS